MIRIPSGYTNPDWLATQIYKEAVFEARFTDTKGSPLEGGMAILDLSFGKAEPSIEHIAVSDATGFASQRIEFGRCYGGVEAQDFVHTHKEVSIHGGVTIKLLATPYTIFHWDQ
ncbi:hypothetical protein PSPPH_3918 [Pseudomonas savastanoi pv. phaseolicola 1448A]|uniref:Uncharacterized protein n=1 Tax=Pseudomonas savastanoi pv. phaseolicola (strain 1448A / Race 6) TaxID=264730 RepID=Q48EY3_PSE14|nr:hypothetical protein PSPPH_3918 [Pseudomonas savastanoi pv. phaseolicola 1448A]